MMFFGVDVREAGDAIPELEKLLEICDFFSCKLDELVRKSLSVPRPENDVNAYLGNLHADFS
jgi:hypothetical protein